MEIQLINGRFTPQEAEQLLTAIFQAKLNFHENKIRTLDLKEEDIKQSEKKIVMLQSRLKNTIEKIRQSGKELTDINAHIDISFAPVLTP